MEIVISPDPRLLEVCDPCDFNDNTLKQLAQDMTKIMYDNNGCGLAAVQVGVMKRMLVIDCDTKSNRRKPIILINPEIVALSDDEICEEEGCLSLPGISVPITRPSYAKVNYYDLNGKLQSIEGDGLLARCLQHEIDHLNGKTMFEACSLKDKVKASNDYKIALSLGAKPGDTGA